MNLIVRNEQIRTVLKEQLHLRWRKLGKGNHVRNSDRSLVLRKLFATNILKRLE